MPILIYCLTIIINCGPTFSQHWHIWYTLMWRIVIPQYLHPSLVQCWPTVCDAGPTLNQPWESVSGMLVSGTTWNRAVGVYVRWIIRLILGALSSPVLRPQWSKGRWPVMMWLTSGHLSPRHQALYIGWLTGSHRHWKPQTVQNVLNIPCKLRCLQCMLLVIVHHQPVKCWYISIQTMETKRFLSNWNHHKRLS